MPGGRHAIELRHPSWWCEDVYELLRRRGAALVIADRKGHDFPHEIVGDWTFVRLHFGHRGRRGSYSRTEIEEWGTRIARWRRRADVYAYFNNDWEGFAPRNARALLDVAG